MFSNVSGMGIKSSYNLDGYMLILPQALWPFKCQRTPTCLPILDRGVLYISAYIMYYIYICI